MKAGPVNVGRCAPSDVFHRGAGLIKWEASTEEAAPSA